MTTNKTKETKQELKEEDVATLEIKEETTDTIKVEVPDKEVVEIDKKSLVEPEIEPTMEETTESDVVSKSAVLEIISRASARTSRTNGVTIAVREVRAMLNGIKEDIEKL